MDEINHQLDLCAAAGATGAIENSIRTTGVKDALANIVVERVLRAGIDMRKVKKTKVAASAAEADLLETLRLLRSKSPVNPLFEAKGERASQFSWHLSAGSDHRNILPGVNVHKDTPTEILHTILLGIVKYFRGQTMFALDKGKMFEEFRSRLNSVDSSGLNIPKLPADYMCKHQFSLIGKHFKSIVQVMPFILHDLVEADLLAAWTALGRLTVMLWCTEIDDIDSYVVRFPHVCPEPITYD